MMSGIKDEDGPEKFWSWMSDKEAEGEKKNKRKKEKGVGLAKHYVLRKWY